MPSGQDCERSGGLWRLPRSCSLLRGGRPARSSLIVTVAAVLVLNVPLAHDLSRSASIMIPAAVLGMLLLARARPSLAVWPLAAALVINLLLPARHVTEGWDEVTPLYSFASSWLASTALPSNSQRST